jgi:peptidoglycan/LPS O-acetylase OafA/YrhL
VAALSVAFVHVANDAVTAGRDPTGAIGAMSRFMPWAAGVDIFFVISGFIIVHASASLFGRPGGAARFLRRRLTRIVPLYWILTTLFLATLVLRRSAVHGDIGSTGYILSSYLFLPAARPDGLVEPALGLGWTLNYEMFFYLVLTPFLLLSRNRAVFGSGAALCLLVAARQMFGFPGVPLNVWSDPIVLEFVLGMGLALAAAAGFSLPVWLRLALVGVAAVALHVAASDTVDPRVITFGLPGALLVAAAISGQSNEPLGRSLRWGIRLGDASYAMYLFHPFIMRGFTILAAHITSHTEPGGIIYIITSLIVAELCALAINAGLERKLTAMLRGRGKLAPAEG